MAIKCGWASIGSNGKVSGDIAGDNNGREVKVGSWYNFGQKAVYRLKDSEKADKLADLIEKACLNDAIGYDQNQRLTLALEASKVGYELDKIVNKCECDCSSLVACALIGVGVNVNRAMTTSSLDSILMSTGQFEKLTDSKYLTSGDNLKRGDIINCPAKHVITALENGINEVDEEPQDTNIVYYPKYYGSSASIVDALKSMNIDTSFTNRKAIAEVNGINNYSGTIEQNTLMLGLLKMGMLKSIDTVIVYFPIYEGDSNSIVDALKELDIDKSYTYRTQIAKVNGIISYSGGASENLLLLSQLKQGCLIKP